MLPLAVTVKTLKQAEYRCNVLVYHMCCLLGPSAFSHLAYDSCVPVLLQLFFVFAFFPLGPIMSSAAHAFTTRALKVTRKRLSFLLSLIKRFRDRVQIIQLPENYTKSRLSLLQAFPSEERVWTESPSASS